MVIAVSVLCALMGLALGFLLAKVNLSKQVETAKAEAQAVSDSLKGQVASLQANLLVAENNAALIKQHAAESKKEREEDFARQLNAMKAQFVAVSEELYDKFCTFSESFVKVGEQLETVRGTYDKAKGQLNEGRGNIISRFQGMQSLGITSTKTVNEKLLS